MGVRLDLWLKWACLFKHRAQATEACRGGLVQLNGRRVKPSTDVSEGDVVELGGEWPRRFVILSVPERQMSKEDARASYRDESPPRPERAKTESDGLVRERGQGRPTKKERREIERLRRGWK